MINRLRLFLAPPVFQDEEKTRIAALLNTVIYSLIALLVVVSLIAIIVNIVVGEPLLNPIVIVAATLVFMGMIPLMRLGFVNQVGAALAFVMSGVISFQLLTSPSLASSTTNGYIISIVVAGLFASGVWPSAAITAFNMASILVLNYAAVQGMISAQPLAQGDFIAYASAFVLTALVVGLVSRSIHEASEKARKNEAAQIKANQELRGLQASLEQRVNDRTRALSTSVEVSRRLTAILEPRQLANEVVSQVQTAFNYYYAQIYLFDETGENLVLTAGTGEAGATMMKRGHSLPTGRGLVGRAAESNQSVLVLDTSQDPNWLPNEFLPDTKTEAVVPIAIGDQVLGILDVQHNLINGITPEDLTLLESLASQVAISLQNADLYARAEAALQEARTLVDNAPEAIVIVDLVTGMFSEPNENAVKLYGLQRDELVKVGPAQMSPPIQPDGRDSTEKAMEKIGEAMQGGRPVFDWTHRNSQGQDFPCEVRLVRLPGDHPRVRASVTDISERKHLEELTAQRAQQQEAINTISQKIQSTTTIEAALQVAARELGRALGGRQTLVALEPPALPGAGSETRNQ